MKKFYKIFAIMIVFAMCALLAACGDKYKSMGFEISYAFSADASADDWIKVENNNLSIYYGSDSDKLQMTEQGANLTATIFLKIKVTGVDEKYIDGIKITNLGAGDHSGAGCVPAGLIANNTPTAVNVSFNKHNQDDNYIRTTLKVYEIASNKSAEMDFKVSPSLKSMSMNTGNLAAVGVGGSVQLNEQNINYLPAGTLQIGAKYEFDSVGYYTTDEEDGSLVWHPSNAVIAYKQMVSVSETGLVSVKPGYDFHLGTDNPTNYVVRVKATSVYNPNVPSTLVDVYVVDRLAEYTPQLTFVSTSRSVGSSFALYSDGGEYGYVDVELNDTSFESIYKEGLITANGLAKYELRLFIDGQPYQPNGVALDNSDYKTGTYNGLKIEERGDNLYRIIASNVSPNQNRVEIRYVITNIVNDRAGSAVANYNKIFDINKYKLPTKIMVTNDNNETLSASDGETIAQSIFSSTNNLNLILDTDVVGGRDTITIKDATGVNGTFSIFGWDSTDGRTGNIRSGDRINVKFAASDVSSGDLIVKVRSIPTSFAGEQVDEERYITVTIRITKVVTADRVLAYADYLNNDNNVPISADMLSGAINIEENTTGYVYLKVYYAGGSGDFDASTLKLVASNGNVLFDNGTSEKILDDYVVTSGIEGGKNFNIYKIALSVADMGQDDVIRVLSNNGKLALLNSDTSINIRSVHLAQGDIRINSKSGIDAIELDVDNGHQNFALVVGRPVVFALEDSKNNSNSIKQISTQTYGDDAFYRTEGLDINAIGVVSQDRNSFAFDALSPNTKLLNVTVYYYAKDADKNIIILTSKTIVAEFAVYIPINGIEKPKEDTKIAYIEGYPDVSSAVINFSATNMPSTKVMFTNGQAEVAMVPYTEIPSRLTAIITDLDGSTIITDPNVEIINNVEADGRSGSVVVTLKGETTIAGVNINIVNTRFGRVNAEASTSTKVIITNCQSSDSVRIWNDVDNPVIDDSFALDEESKIYSIYLSLLNVAENGSVTASFYASAEWDTEQGNNYRIYDLDKTIEYYRTDTSTGKKSFVEYPYAGFTVDISDTDKDEQTKLVTLNGLKNGGGGIFKVTIGAKNSLTSAGFTAYETILVYIADGTKDNKYNIASEADFFAINNDLNAHYVLTEDFEVNISNNKYPIGTTVIDAATKQFSVSEFTGSLTGEQIVLDYAGNEIKINHKINALINVSNAVANSAVEDKNVGLFAKLGNGAIISNLAVRATIIGTAEGSINVGAIAGVNNGNINNVNIQLADYSTNIRNRVTFNKNTNTNVLNYGGIVGLNKTGIALANNSVVCINTVEIISKVKDANIGLVAGKNEGVILGNYLGKDSLESVNYNVIASLSAYLADVNATYNVGGIVGYSNGTIGNVIAGGKIGVYNSGATVPAQASHIGGVVGCVVKEATTGSGIINNVAAFGLDIIDNRAGDYIGGIAGRASGATINNTKTIFANMLFDNMETTGQIRSSGRDTVIAGVVAIADDSVGVSTISKATVENFVSLTSGDFYALVSTNGTVAGIATGVANISSCFVNANLQNVAEDSRLPSGKVYVLTDESLINSYYIGKVKGFVSSTRIANKASVNDLAVFNSTASNFGLAKINGTQNTYGLILLNDGYYSVYEQQIQRVETLKKDVVEHDTLFDVTTDTTDLTDIYYIDEDGIYQKATSVEEGVDYYKLKSSTWTSRANYVLVDNTLTKTKSTDEYNGNAKYYHIDNSNIVDGLYIYNDKEYVSYVGETLDVNTTYYLKTLNTPYFNHAVALTNINLVENSSEKINNLLPIVINSTTGGVESVYANLWALDKDINAVNVAGATIYLPYLLEANSNGGTQPLMIVRPTDIDVDINQEYVQGINSIYIDGGIDLTFLQSTIYQTAIVNFINNGDIDANTHQIVNTSAEGEPSNGLVDLQVVQQGTGAGATAGVQFTIVSGVGYAYISGSNIVFTEASGKTPIVIRCFSSFDNTIEEYIVFFTQPGVTKLIVSGENVSTSRKTGIDYETYVYVSSDENRNKTNIQFTTLNLFKGQTVSSILSDVTNTNIRDYLVVKAESLSATTYISIKDYQNNSLEKTLSVLVGQTIDPENNYQDIRFTLLFDVYGYYKNNNGDSYFEDGTKIELGSSVVRVNIYNSADRIVVNSSGIATAITSSTLHFVATMYTGYVNAENTDIQNDVKFVVNEHNQIILRQEDQDSIIIKLTPAESQEITNLMKRADVTNFVDLFNATIVCKYVADDNGIGYEYNIYLSLKNEFNYRYIESDVNFNVNISAKSNSTAQAELNFTYSPQPLQEAGVSIDNYAVKEASASNNYQNILASAVPSSTIEPGGLGSILVIKMQPSYGGVNSATITTDVLSFAQGTLRLEFEQLYYDEELDMYKSLTARQTENKLGIYLDKVSCKKAGSDKTEYNGVIYVHAYISKRVAGLSTSISAHLSITTPDSVINKDCVLYTKFIPGASISMRDAIKAPGKNSNNNASLTDVKDYLVQKNSKNIFDITLYGFQFNAVPDVNFTWLNPDTEATKNVNVLEFVSYGDMTDYKTLQPTASGAYVLQFSVTVWPDIPAPFKMSVNLQLAIDNKSDEKSCTVVLYPTDYIIRDVGYQNLNNNQLNIRLNDSKSVDFNFVTDGAGDTQTINNAIIEKLAQVDIVKLFTIVFNDIDTSLEDKGLQSYLTAGLDADKLVIVGSRVIQTTMKATVKWAYQDEDNDGVFELEFVTPNEGDSVYSKFTSFSLNVYATTSEDDPIRISSASQFQSINNGGANNHYILMEDITLTSFTPITQPIASLDGNNKIITIESFADDSSLTNYGLFASLSSYTDKEGNEHKSLLKNVVVAYGNNVIVNMSENNSNQYIFGGLVAENSGLIYNCDVVNASTETENMLTVNMKDSVNVTDKTTLTFGGLVGVNSGVITNSRVGRLSMPRIGVDKSSITSISVGQEYFNTITMTIGSSKTDDVEQEKQFNRYTAIAGGFVGRNSGKIASSYLANASLINYSSESTTSRTAGFAAENTTSGEISYSYVKADEGTVSSSKARAKDEVIKNASNGTVAGFVHYNNGNIYDCFANTMVESRSTYISGFVHENADQGYIKNCYAACTLNGGVGEGDEQPFVGIDVNSKDPLSNGRMENVYYYDANEHITQEAVTSANMPQAVPLNTENIKNSNNLHGFVFINTSNVVEREQGVWTYIPVGTYNSRILPELTSANQIAVSNRYELNGKLTNAYNYVAGSVNNPYIIRDASEFNQVFTEGGHSNTFSGYVRLIDNVNFNTTSSLISTKTNFTLGNNNVTSIDGNGMKISNIELRTTAPNANKIGLFASIKNAYIKNLDLSLTAGEPSSFLASSLGGLAGEIESSVIVNIDIDGAEANLTGANFVGGLAGRITGKTILYGISTNVNVGTGTTRTSNAKLYYSASAYDVMSAMGYYTGSYASYISNLSYAGGLAGVIDISARGSEEYNLSYIDVNRGKDGSANGQISIEADYAGGIAGYVGSGVNALRLKYHVGLNDSIRGGYVAGGLFGASSAESIVASQVTAETEDQYGYDTSFAQYIEGIETKTGTPNINTDEIGNKNLVQSKYFAGGLVGVAIKTHIDSCYSKASLSGAKLGGLIGVSVASSTTYSYATPYINNSSEATFNRDTKLQLAGGLIGEAYGVGSSYNTSSNREVKEWASYLQSVMMEPNTNAEIINTFSTLLIDVNKNWSDVKLDYIVANDVQPAGSVNSHVGGFVSGVYAGVVQNYVEHDITIGHQLKDIAGAYDQNLVKLYRKEEESFNEIFTSWANQYWSLSNAKYFPLLESEEAENFIPITTVADLLSIYGSGNYMVKVAELDLTGVTLNGNWVIESNFTGKLVGSTTDVSSGTPVIKGIHLTPNSMDSSGFFKNTNGATISNLIFEWGVLDSRDDTTNDNIPGVDVKDTNITTFGGVTASDTDSKINNVIVRAPVSETNTVNKTTPFLKTTGKHIEGFGGIVGVGSGTQIGNCKFNGVVEATVSGTNAHIGGLIAEGRQEDSLEEERKGYIDITSSRVGDISYTKFDLTVTAGTVSVGGAVGSIKNGNVSAIQVGNIGSDVEIKVNTQEGNGTANIAGFIGTAIDKMQLNNDAVFTKIHVVGPGANNGQHRIAGLVGSYSSSRGVNLTSSGSMVKANIRSNTQIKNLSMAGGIAHVNNANVQIETSSYTGVITTVNETGDTTNVSNNENVVAGGIVGEITNEGMSNQIVLDTVFNDVDITVGTATTNILYLGGLIGCGNLGAGVVAPDLYVFNSLNAGRLIVNGLNEEATATYIGGVAAFVGSAKISNLISIPLIVTDGIQGAAVSKLNNIHALFGTAGSVTTNVDALGGTTDGGIYYSTDYSLFAETTDEEDDNIYNLPINAIVNSPNTVTWKNKLSGRTWNLDNNTTPYPVSVRTQLVSLGVLTKLNNTFEQGSRYNPYRIESTFGGAGTVDFNRYTTYTYFILSPSYSGTFTGELNGVIVGNNENFVIESYNQAFIPTVKQHSVVSNVHLLFKTNSAIETSVDGLVVDVNHGVMSNVSVQGTGLTLSSSSSEWIGLIAGTNDGIMQYCFTSAEIVNVAEDVIKGVAGIVGTNSGLINSCYFTGYINNSTESSTQSIAATGITCTNSEGSYIYNCYMGGVIELMSSDIFAGYTETAPYQGNNNYIDKWIYGSNTSSATFKNSTMSIYKASGLKGNWYSLIKDDAIDRTAINYGYNYGYPIYQLKSVNSTSLRINDMQFQLFTGTGDFDEAGTEMLEERANNILKQAASEEVVYDYTKAYKIPHLGVLSSLSGLLDYNLNYVIIYDIKGKSGGTNLEWESIAATGKSFNGVLVSNKNYAFTPLKVQEESPESECTIENLNKQGLFVSIEKAYIGYLKFDGEFKGFTGGLLGDISEVEDNTSTKTVYVKNITFGNCVIEAKSEVTNLTTASYIAGLFGIIPANNIVEVRDIQTSMPYDGDTETVTIINKETDSGLIAARNNGVINLYNTQVSVKFKDQGSTMGYSGGLVGVNGTNGIIDNKTVKDTSGEQDIIKERGTVTIYTEADEHSPKVLNLGGLVGKMQAKGKLNNLSVSVDYDAQCVTAVTFGGLIAEFDGDTEASEIIDCTFMPDSGTLVLSYNKYFGVVAAKVKQGKLKVSNLDMGKLATVNNQSKNLVVYTSYDMLLGNGDDEISYAPDNLEGFTPVNSSGIGSIVGELGDKDIESSNAPSIFITLKSTRKIYIESLGTTNLGGIAGIYRKGSIYIDQTGTTDLPLEIELKGAKNVGGVFGRTEVSIDGTTFFNGASDWYAGASEWAVFNYLASSYATINVAPGNENVGGLFGYANAGLQNLTNSNQVQYTNAGYRTYNVVTFREDNSYIALNVGGVVGTVSLGSGKNYQNLNNTASLKYKSSILGNLGDETGEGEVTDKYYLSVHQQTLGSEDQTSEEGFVTIVVNNVGGVIGNLTSTTLDTTFNVEGITNGYEFVANSPITGNTSEVQGYQNVGGIIGYVSGKINIQPFIITEGSGASTQTTTVRDVANTSSRVAGVINVGGLVGYLGQGATMQDAKSRSDVLGNVNVGGLVGMLHAPTGSSATLRNCSAEKVVDATSTDVSTRYGQINIIGVLLNNIETYRDDVRHEEYTNRYYFIPTNVGGLVGMSYNGSLKSTTGYKLYITSTQEGYENASQRLGITISTASNLMGQPVASDGSVQGGYVAGTYEESTVDRKLYKYLSTTDKKVSFDNVKSGFGGYIGAQIGDVTSDGSGDTNTITNVQVNAKLGINVAALYGYYRGTPKAQPAPLPSNFNGVIRIANDINVNGAYCVGGVFGYLDSQGNVSFNLNEVINTGASGTGSVGRITLQNTIKGGIYIGAIAGRMRSSGDDSLSLNNQDRIITIYTDYSYYVGGLVGRYVVESSSPESVTFTGTLGNYTVTTDQAGVTSVSSTTPTSSASIYGTAHYNTTSAKTNVGGLIGMLKVEQGNRKTVNVNGYHMYAFTINAIENSNYEEGTSNFSAGKLESDGSSLLVAQANYINLDSFNITKTTNTSWYANTTSKPANEGDYYSLNGRYIRRNPLNSSVGWAKEYTMFKTMQRNIPACTGGTCNHSSCSKTPEWDSIGVVYDAENITGVATIESLGLQSATLQYSNGATKTGNEIGADCICYTIYEEAEGMATLYSRIGVATIYKDGVGDPYKPQDNVEMSTGSKIGYVFGFTDIGSNTYYIDLNNSDNKTQGLTYLTWKINDGDTYKTVGNNNNNMVTAADYNKDGTLVKGSVRTELVYKVETDYYKHYISDDKKDSDLRNGCYFLFTILYNNSSVNFKNQAYTTTDEDLPKDGSIFNVRGMYTQESDLAIHTHKESTGWLEGLKWGIFALEIILTFASMGASAGAGAVKTGVQAGVKVAQATSKLAKVGRAIAKAAKAVAKVLSKIKTIIKWGLRLTTVALIMLSFVQTDREVTEFAFKEYFKRRDCNYGVLSSSYTRELAYDIFEGSTVLRNSIEKPEYYADQIYLYYSSTRPADYYLNYYIGIVYEGSSVQASDQNSITYFTSKESRLELQTPIEGAKDDPWYRTTIDGITYDVYPTYIYRGGQYFVNSMAAELIETTKQLYDESILTNAYDYKLKNGLLYTRGSYNGSAYELAETNDFNNNIHQNATKDGYVVHNNISLDANKVEYLVEANYIPVTNAWLSDANEDVLYSITDDGNAIQYGGEMENNKIIYTNGYGVLKSDMYYALKGSVKKILDYDEDNDAETLSDVACKWAKFGGEQDFVTTSLPEGEAGVDYIIASYKIEVEGVEAERTCYLLINEIDSTSHTSSYSYAGGMLSDANGKKVFNDLPSEEVWLEIYPYSTKPIYSTDALNSAAKVAASSNFWYMSNSLLGDIQVNGNSVSAQTGLLRHNEMFYYYDGGYLYDNEHNKVYTAIKKTEQVYSNGLVDGQTSSEYNLYENEKITLYNADGTVEGKHSIQDLINNYTTLGDYYLVDITDITDPEDVGYLKVKECYIPKDGIMYKIDDTYSYDENKISLVTYSIGYSYKGETNPNTNKYLSNAAHGIYTRFKYKGGQFLNSKWKDGYYLFIEGRVYPNMGTTYLSESVCVTLGCGQDVYCNGITSQKVPCGAINVL